MVRSPAGTQRLENVDIEDLVTATHQTLPAAALFVLVGAAPHTTWLAETIRLDDNGFIVTGPDLGRDAREREPWTGLHRDPYLLETSLAGVFAAGDTRSGSVKRVGRGCRRRLDRDQIRQRASRPPGWASGQRREREGDMTMTRLPSDPYGQLGS